NHLSMLGQELLPGCLPLTFWRRFQTVLPKNVGNSTATDLIAKISQRPLYSPVTPIAVLRSHADHPLLNLVLRARASGATLLAAIILSGDQFPVPSHERFRRNDGGQFVKHTPAQFPGPD